MSQSRTVLYIDLQTRTSEVKVHADTHEFVGGLGLALKLLSGVREKNPVIFSIGPLNKAFPFVSRVCCLFYDKEGNLVETYGGGRLGLVLSLTSFESVVLSGRSPKPISVSVASSKVEFIDNPDTQNPSNVFSLADRTSFLDFSPKSSLIDNYFRLDSRLGGWGVGSNLRGLSFNADRSFRIAKPVEYLRLYQEINSRGQDLSVPYDTSPSCAGCPAGCVSSLEEQFDSSLTTTYCLVACDFAAKIFGHVPTIFSCLQSLGEDYDHETLEALPAKISQMRSSYARL